MMERIKWFKDISSDDIGTCGGKGQNLGIMYNLGLSVPPGFMVTAQAYQEFIEKTMIQDRILDLLKGLDTEDTAKLQQVAETVQKLITSTTMPEEIKEEILENYEALSAEKGDAEKLLHKKEAFVAVRSSATAEDLPEASFAGQQATFLNIRGKEQLIEAVRGCWASLFTARAIYYRQRNNFPHDKVLIAVVIQKMVDSEKSGVMFTVNPATNNGSEMVIEAVFGLGESIVSGAVNPDLYLVNKQDRSIKKIEVRKQEWGLFRNEQGENEKRKIRLDLQEKQILDEKQIKEIARLGKKIEEHYGKPQDIEWAVGGEEIFIVQSRAVTTFKAEEEKQEEITEEAGKILLRGETASAGVYGGAVKLIKEISELNKIKKGDILVTTMTTPDMVPAMQKAGAIVTDEGGMTCFSSSTKVLTSKGFCTMEEMYTRLQNEKIKVLSFNPNTMKMEWKTALNPQKKRSNLWKVAVSQTGRSQQNTLEITPNHKMVTLDHRRIVKRELNNLIDNQEMACVADFLPANQNPHVLSEPDKAYLCGALFTDGYVNSNSKNGYVTFIQKDIPEKKRFINSVKQKYLDVFDSRMDYTRIRSTSGRSIRGKEITGSASDFISFKKKPAEELRRIKENIVDWVTHLDEISLKNFLAGAIDGDGTFNVTHKSGRIQIYVSKEYLAQGVILACLRLGILPQISKQRGTCYNIQIVDQIEELLNHTSRVKGPIKEKVLGTKLFGAKQLFGDIIDKVNFKGKIRPYIQNNLLLDATKIKRNILPLLDDLEKTQVKKIIDSDFRMQRISKVGEIGISEVYNFEVEDNHTYVVFTENYTPVVVWNCHAAIVSREMGTPCIVGTGHGTELLKEGQIVTVHATRGIVYEGKIAVKKQEKPKAVQTENIPITAADIKVILDFPEKAQEVADTYHPDGVGLVRLEFIIAAGGIHPAEYIRQNKDEEYTQLLIEALRKIAAPFKGKPVWLRNSDLRSDEYRNLQGGDQEPQESDPMIGWHGIRRLLDEPRILKAEFQAVKQLHQEGLNNIGIMLPFVISVEELKKAKMIMREVGLEPGLEVDFGVMIETPASCWIIEELCREGIDFVSFGTNDLTQLTLGIDRNNGRIARLFDEMHPAVLGQIAKVVKVCHKYKVKTSICGQAGSRPEMAEFLVHQGVDSISANADAVNEIRRVVARTEQKLLLDAEREELAER